ncbi:MAG: hypothetical protein WCL14_01970 [Bacteroidota bacterium]
MNKALLILLTTLVIGCSTPNTNSSVTPLKDSLNNAQVTNQDKFVGIWGAEIIDGYKGRNLKSHAIMTVSKIGGKKSNLYNIVTRRGGMDEIFEKDNEFTLICDGNIMSLKYENNNGTLTLIPKDGGESIVFKKLD